MEIASVSEGPTKSDKPVFEKTRWQFVLLVPSWLIFVWSVACIVGSAGPLVGLAALWLLGGLAILIHEAGHAVTALLCRWQVVIFAVGPIGYHVPNREFTWLRAADRAEYAGYVVPVPGSRDVWTRWRKKLITFGGPFANLLTAAILLGIFLAPIDWTTENLRLLVFGGALLSLSVALGSTTDAQNLFSRSHVSKEDLDRYGALALAKALLDHQVRLRSLPDWLIDEMTAKAQGN